MLKMQYFWTDFKNLYWFHEIFCSQIFFIFHKLFLIFRDGLWNSTPHCHWIKTTIIKSCRNFFIWRISRENMASMTRLVSTIKSQVSLKLPFSTFSRKNLQKCSYFRQQFKTQDVCQQLWPMHVQDLELIKAKVVGNGKKEALAWVAKMQVRFLQKLREIMVN